MALAWKRWSSSSSASLEAWGPTYSRWTSSLACGRRCLANQLLCCSVLCKWLHLISSCMFDGQRHDCISRSVPSAHESFYNCHRCAAPCSVHWDLCSHACASAGCPLWPRFCFCHSRRACPRTRAPEGQRSACECSPWSPLSEPLNVFNVFNLWNIIEIE